MLRSSANNHLNALLARKSLHGISVYAELLGELSGATAGLVGSHQTINLVGGEPKLHLAVRRGVR